VVLRVDSPGGSAVASDLIWHTALRLKRETRKPLIVSMARAAASGGYHIAIAGDKVYTDRFTITGSIGVLSVRYSLEGWLRKHQIRQDDFERGEFMHAWSTGHDWNARVQAAADSATYADYRSFVSVVANSRGMSWEDVDAVAQGRVWMGQDALDRKLVDAIGGLDEAIAEARRRAGIPVREKLEPVEYRRPRPGLIQALLGSWVRAEWQRNAHLPDSDETRFGMDPDAFSIE
jgi:protease-4